MIYKALDGQDKALSIPLRGGLCVFMLLPAFTGSDTHIVIVDAVKFQGVWDGDHSSGNPDSWCQDSKYSGVAKIFANSKQSPIFPAIISDCVDGKFSFVDGITRTIWLLSHKALYFPLLCSQYAFAPLEQVAGAQIFDSDLQHGLFPAKGVGMVH